MHPKKWDKNFYEAVTAGIDGRIVNLTIGETSLNCVIASVHSSRVRGLSEVSELPHDGMIFIYDRDHSAKFHRQGMSMDISIWFFDAQGNLVGSGWTGDVATASEPYRYVVETHPDVELEGRLSIQTLLS